jgi:site-specific DNA-methyltransferase (adenine-specific)
MNWTDKITVTNEDNIELMARYPDKYFDLAIVDPPYGLGVKNIICETGKWKRNIHNKNKNWDNETPTKEYFNELKRVSKNQMIWGANHFIEDIPKANSSCWLVWDKNNGDNFMSDCELCYTSFNTSVRKFKYNHIQEFNLKIDKIHPTQKPIALYKWILDKYAKQGDKILDTHLGSGSIAIACHDYGFELTACELDKEYYDSSYKRFKNHISQQRIEF